MESWSHIGRLIYDREEGIADNSKYWYAIPSHVKLVFVLKAPTFTQKGGSCCSPMKEPEFITSTPAIIQNPRPEIGILLLEATDGAEWSIEAARPRNASWGSGLWTEASGLGGLGF